MGVKNVVKTFNLQEKTSIENHITLKKNNHPNDISSLYDCNNTITLNFPTMLWERERKLLCVTECVQHVCIYNKPPSSCHIIFAHCPACVFITACSWLCFIVLALIAIRGCTVI